MAALAAATLAATANADTFGSGANQFSIDFVNIGHAGNAATYIDYGTAPALGDDYDAPYAGYGAVAYDYRLGKYEVTIDQFAKAYAADDTISNGNENYWNDGTRNVGDGAPACALTWTEAARFANWLTSGSAGTGVYQFSGNTLTGINRSYRNESDLAYVLPTDDEWYKAAFYKPVNDGSYSLYASGLSTDPVVGTSNGWNYDPFHSGSATMWETGFGAAEQNGTYDMMGNAWEWTETTTTNSQWVFRGGSAYAPEEYLDSETYRPSHISEEAVHVGFRIAAIPEPGSLAMMALMGSCIWGIRRFFRV